MGSTVRTGRGMATVVCTAGLVLAGASAAVATTGEATSTPGYHLTVSSSLSSSTDRDHDDNADTAKAGDTVVAYAWVRNNTDGAQTVTVTYTLDAPGTAYDTTHTEQVDLGAGQTATHAGSLRVVGRFPPGPYHLTTTATGTEQASATGSIILR